jgi:hypothetical protein
MRKLARTGSSSGWLSRATSGLRERGDVPFPGESARPGSRTPRRRAPDIASYSYERVQVGKSKGFDRPHIFLMSVNANTLAKKEHYYTVLAHSINELAQATAKYQGLMDKIVQQHKAISSMTVYHAAQ